MPFRPADDLILAGLRGSCERGVSFSTRRKFRFPVHICHIFFIEELTGRCPEFHNHEIVNNSSIVGGAEGDFLTGRDRKLVRLELKVGHSYINGGRYATTSATRRENYKQQA